MTQKRLEITRHLGRWEVVHNGVALCDFDTAEEAARAADAVARSQPEGDRVIISVDSAARQAIAAALTSSQP
ncbi:MAG TPA: hypothetical protein VHZ26_04965 [Caulobacteraceae bacterium]|nr:hypothetical protein [Caulobacteraceae bacterium]